MIGVATKEDIRKRYILERQSIRQIARETGHSRQYVRKVIVEEVPTIPQYRLTKEKDKPVVGPYLDIITDWIKEEETRPTKQRHTAFRICKRLCEEHGIKGAATPFQTLFRYLPEGLRCACPGPAISPTECR